MRLELWHGWKELFLSNTKYTEYIYSFDSISRDMYLGRKMVNSRIEVFIKGVSTITSLFTSKIYPKLKSKSFKSCYTYLCYYMSLLLILNTLDTTSEINTSGQNYEFKVPVDKLLGYGAINLNFVFISNAKC